MLKYLLNDKFRLPKSLTENHGYTGKAEDVTIEWLKAAIREGILIMSRDDYSGGAIDILTCLIASAYPNATIKTRHARYLRYCDTYDKLVKKYKALFPCRALKLSEVQKVVAKRHVSNREGMSSAMCDLHSNVNMRDCYLVPLYMLAMKDAIRPHRRKVGDAGTAQIN